MAPSAAHRRKRDASAWDGTRLTFLPLWKRVVFVDWNGVLNHDYFWSSIVGSSRHPLQKPLAEATRRLFQEHRETLRAWMRGRLTSREIVAGLDLPQMSRYPRGFLLRRLDEDCRRMRCVDDLVQALRTVKADCFVVLATDNMDCFWSAVPWLDDLTTTVDAILCSTRLGRLKKDGIASFFSPWLVRHNLTFSDALLLDDCVETCEAFRHAGGASVVVASPSEAIAGLYDWVRSDSAAGKSTRQI